MSEHDPTDKNIRLDGDTFWTTDDCETLEANRPKIYASNKTYFKFCWLCMGSNDEDVDGFPYCNRLRFIVSYTLSGLGTNDSSQPVPGLWPQLPKHSQLFGDDGLKVNKVGH